VTSPSSLTSQVASYRGFAGKRLALVESMLHEAFYNGIHDAMDLGLEVWLLIRDREWYGSPAAWADHHPLDRVHRLIVTDTHDPRAVAAAVTDAQGRPLVDGVMTFSDYHTEVAATVAGQLGLPGPGVRPFATANHKHLLREALRGRPYTINHVLAASAAELPSAARRLGFPMVAKPPAEAISYGVRRVDDPASLMAAFTELSAIRHSLRGQPRPGHVLLESYIDAPEVSVESITIDGHTHFYGTTAKTLADQPTFLERAHAFPARLDPDVAAEVYRVVAEALALIGYHQGPAHTELKLTRDGPKLIEINPRLPAGNITTMVREVCQRDPHLDAKLLAVGGRPLPPTDPHRGGAAVVVLYPPRRPGVFVALDNVAEAEAVPGVRVVPMAHPGDELWHRVDNSARVALVSARGQDADAALAAATRAAALIAVRIAEEPS
jgi:biotin carboxylase